MHPIHLANSRIRHDLRYVDNNVARWRSSHGGANGALGVMVHKIEVSTNLNSCACGVRIVEPCSRGSDLEFCGNIDGLHTSG